VLAVCVLLLTGPAGCGSGGAQGSGKNGQASAPAGELLGDTDRQGRPYREVDEEGAPDVRIEVQPAAGDTGWNVRLTVRDFRFSPAGAKPEAVAGRGVVRLFVDGRPVTELRTLHYRLSARYVAHGTHQVTARLYADDGTVWAVDGEPVESTADITASQPTASQSDPTASQPGPTAAQPDPTASEPAPAGTPNDALSAPGTPLRTQERGSPDRGGKAS
jgi:hypothetical protein